MQCHIPPPRLDHLEARHLVCPRVCNRVLIESGRGDEPALPGAKLPDVPKLVLKLDDQVTFDRLLEVFALDPDVLCTSLRGEQAHQETGGGQRVEHPAEPLELTRGKRSGPIDHSWDYRQKANDRHENPSHIRLLGEDVAVVRPGSNSAREGTTERGGPAALLKKAGDLLLKQFAFGVVLFAAHVSSGTSEGRTCEERWRTK